MSPILAMVVVIVVVMVVAMVTIVIVSVVVVVPVSVMLISSSVIVVVVVVVVIVVTMLVTVVLVPSVVVAIVTTTTMTTAAATGSRIGVFRVGGTSVTSRNGCQFRLGLLSIIRLLHFLDILKLIMIRICIRYKRVQLPSETDSGHGTPKVSHLALYELKI